VDLSVSVNQVLKVARVLLLHVRKYTQTHCEHSSLRVIRYCAPPEDQTGAGPQRSELTWPRITSDLGVWDAGNDTRVILPRIHEEQVGGVALSSCFDILMPVTKPFRTIALTAW
jgi:hypothetical protein